MGKLLVRLRRRFIHLIARSIGCIRISGSQIFSVKIFLRSQRHTFHLPVSPGK